MWEALTTTAADTRDQMPEHDAKAAAAKGSTENLPDIAGRVGFMPRAGGCAMARWGRGWVSAPAQHRDHLRAVPPACRARNLTRN